MKDAADFFARSRNARRVLVIDPGLLGDTVHRLPVLWELRRNYPRAELHALCSPVGAAVLELAGCADRLWILDQDRERRTLLAQVKLLRELRRLRFDVSINFGDNDRNVFYAGLIGARHRLGLRRDRWHFWSRWCIRHWVRSPGRGLPVFEQRRRMLAAAGFPVGEPQFGLRVPEPARAWAETQIPAGAIHFSLSASLPLKEWPLPHWIELARRWLRKQPDAVLVATASANRREQERLDAFVAAVGSPAVRAFAGLSLAQLSAVLTRCACHVGADSGVLHLAAALGVPTVGLFRRYPRVAEWLPRGPQHRHLVADCDCIFRGETRCEAAGVAVCLGSLTAEAVEAALISVTSGAKDAEAAPRITVAICTRNRAGSLERAVQSVLPQLAAGEELLVVDDGSTDDTEQRLAAVAAAHPQVRVARTAGVGIATARNAALAEARGDWVLFLDDDETAEAGWLAAYRDFLVAPPGPCVGAVGGPYQAEFEKPPPRWLDDTFGSYDHRDELRALDGRLTLPGGNCLFLKSAVEKAGGFAEDLERGEDSELNLRLRDAGYETWWLPAARVRHHIPVWRTGFGARMALAIADGRSVARIRLRRCGGIWARARFAAGRCLAGPLQCAALAVGAVALVAAGRTPRAVFDLTRGLRAVGIAWELVRRPGQVLRPAPGKRRGD